MNVITSAFWGEGPSDERFLPKLIQRVIEKILLECARGEWEVIEPVILKSKKAKFVDQVEEVARKAVGLTFLFIHTDADARNEDEKAIPNKISPAFARLESLPKEEVCKDAIAVIPVTKIENWKLADLHTLCHVFGVDFNWSELNLNLKTTQREQAARSKELLEGVVQQANEARKNRRTRLSVHDLDEALSKQISLSSLAQYQSFQRFSARLKSKLMARNIIVENCTVKLW
ncbi:MAG: hypothetical protein AAF804_08435 [Bacteroidota bacterium]